MGGDSGCRRASDTAASQRCRICVAGHTSSSALVGWVGRGYVCACLARAPRHVKNEIPLCQPRPPPLPPPPPRRPPRASSQQHPAPPHSRLRQEARRAPHPHKFHSRPEASIGHSVPHPQVAELEELRGRHVGPRAAGEAVDEVHGGGATGRGSLRGGGDDLRRLLLWTESTGAVYEIGRWGRAEASLRRV